VREYFFSIYLEKLSGKPELLLELTDHRIMEGLSRLYMPTRKYPWCIGCMSSQEDLTVRIKDEGAYDDFHREKLRMKYSGEV
jgi:hypothetical protein